MPRPGQVVPRAAADAEHGSTAALQRLASAVPRVAPAAAPEQVRPPAGSPSPPAPPGAGQLTGDLNDGFDSALFGPTNRPNEPITEGAPFGPGSNYVRRPYEDDRSFMLRVAQELEAGPEAGPLAAYIEDIRKGR